MDDTKCELETELNSTMGNVLPGQTNKDEDSTPTSSTDTNAVAANDQIASDDTISSTSSDLRGKSKTEAKNSSVIGSDVDLLDMNITDVSTEKITEDVEDIVQDLENLLGEPSPSYSSSKTKKSDSENPKDDQDLESMFNDTAFLPQEETASKLVSKESTIEEKHEESKDQVDECISIENKETVLATEIVLKGNNIRDNIVEDARETITNETPSIENIEESAQDGIIDGKISQNEESQQINNAISEEVRNVEKQPINEEKVVASLDLAKPVEADEIVRTEETVVENLEIPQEKEIITKSLERAEIKESSSKSEENKETFQPLEEEQMSPLVAEMEDSPETEKNISEVEQKSPRNEIIDSGKETSENKIISEDTPTIILEEDITETQLEIDHQTEEITKEPHFETQTEAKLEPTAKEEETREREEIQEIEDSSNDIEEVPAENATEEVLISKTTVSVDCAVAEIIEDTSQETVPETAEDEEHKPVENISKPEEKECVLQNISSNLEIDQLSQETANTLKSDEIQEIASKLEEKPELVTEQIEEIKEPENDDKTQEISTEINKSKEVAANTEEVSVPEEVSLPEKNEELNETIETPTLLKEQSDSFAKSKKLVERAEELADKTKESVQKIVNKEPETLNSNEEKIEVTKATQEVTKESQEIREAGEKSNEAPKIIEEIRNQLKETPIEIVEPAKEIVAAPTKIEELPTKVESAEILSTLKEIVATPKEIVATSKEIVTAPTKIEELPTQIESTSKQTVAEPEEILAALTKTEELPTKMESTSKEIDMAPKKVEEPFTEIEKSPKEIEVAPTQIIEKPKEIEATPETVAPQKVEELIKTQKLSKKIIEPSKCIDKPSKSFEEPSKNIKEPSKNIKVTSKSLEEPSKSIKELSKKIEEPSESIKVPSKGIEEPSKSIGDVPEEITEAVKEIKEPPPQKIKEISLTKETLPKIKKPSKITEPPQLKIKAPQTETELAISSLLQDQPKPQEHETNYECDDQTNAAVLSILQTIPDSEENPYASVSEQKIELPQSQSAFSSYEVQRAVEGIQGEVDLSEDSSNEYVETAVKISSQNTPVEVLKPVPEASISVDKIKETPKVVEQEFVKEVVPPKAEPPVIETPPVKETSPVKETPKEPVKVAPAPTKPAVVAKPVIKEVKPPKTPTVRKVSYESSDSSSSDEVTESPPKKLKTEDAPRRDVKQPLSIEVNECVKDKPKPYSPKITIKPIKPPTEEETKGSLKITITKQSDNTHSSILKIFNAEDETEEEVHVKTKKFMAEEQSSPKSPKVTRGLKKEGTPNSPRITIKPIPKPEEVSSPLKITIKAVPKPDELCTKQKHSPIPRDHSPRQSSKLSQKEEHSPRITIKPIQKPSPQIVEEAKISSPKITIKPVVKPVEDEDEEIKERIVLKINKGNLPHKEPRKREGEQEDKTESKLAKIKLKFSKEGGHAHIVQPTETETSSKRSVEDSESERSKRLRTDITSTIDERVTHLPVEPEQIPEPAPVVAPAPRKRGRPRKVPLEVRQEYVEPAAPAQLPPGRGDDAEAKATTESGRPKRSCRGQSVCATLGIKPKKTRMPRGRGTKRGGGSERESTRERVKPQESLLTKEALQHKQVESIDLTIDDFDIEDQISQVTQINRESETPKREPNVVECMEVEEDVKTKTEDAEPVKEPLKIDMDEAPMSAPPTEEPQNSSDIVMFEEETRMSADVSSRAETPQKTIIQDAIIEESQSSEKSTATSESAKDKRKSRLEVFQEPEGAVISAESLTEYYWNGNGPFMLQEQVAQFLGIKSFKRKYPGIMRRMVDMQERDFIRESGLASEHMCDLGLTAVNSADILDIMYSDFQEKYEEYCKHQRDRQAKDLINKQKALSLATSQEKSKLDIVAQAIQSAATFNLNFNKTRNEQRRACMDLQTLTVHFPKGRIKKVDLPPLGNYPVALVPGQFTDFYKDFTPTELNNLPLNTMTYKELHRIPAEESSDSSESDSDSSSSDSDSDSSCPDNCKMCVKEQKTVAGRPIKA